MKEDNMISSKDKLKETWRRYNKYIILSVCLIIVLVVAFVIFNKKDKGNRYQDIERIMIINAQNYIKNNNINENYYVSLNNLNIKIDESLKCNNLSGVYKDNDSYYPYLVCQDYKSKKINDLIEENDKSKEYGELNGDSLYFVVNDKYQDAGVKTDYQVNVKGDDIDNGLNFVTYYINDNGKNLGELKRIVIGEEVIGSVPVLTLVGEKTRTISKGSIYNEIGYNAIDEKDGNITDKVVVEGNVNTNEAGTYKLVYSVTNSRGKKATTERTIIVNESNINLDITHSLNPKEVTKKNVTITVKVNGNGYKSIVLPDKSESKNSEVSYTVYKSGTYDFIVYDINNNSEVYSVEVKNIKKDPPSGSCIVTYENSKSTLKISANDKETISSYEIYNDNKFLIKQKIDSYSFNDYPIETKVKMTDVISQSSTITCKIIDKDPKYFTSGVFKKRHSNGMRYFLYVPKDANIHEKLPLIISLHGSNEIGNNLSLITTAGLPRYMNKGTIDSFNIRAVIIAPQSTTFGWEGEFTRLIELIGSIKQEYNINDKKVILHGISMGGLGGCKLINMYPDMFSAFVAIAAANETVDISNSLNIPIRVYTGKQDTKWHERTKKYAEKVKNAGGNVELIIFNNQGHGIGSYVYEYEGTDIIEWSLRQERR